ncbi:MAG: DUF2828 family protein, partial [Erysipelotrichaceae bacterium]|nr:DUF2828 family protein [Erysipelotrichaceae bacterium]
DYTFDYAKQPSRAMFKYRQAFFRNDKERYLDFMNSVSNGEATMHADNVSPYELVESCLHDFRWHIGYCVKELSESEEKALNATWDSLPDYGGNENILAVIDTSGSMYSCFNPMPASVALSLGLYFAGRNTGMFRNHFIEFSARPQLIELKGETFTDQLRYVASFNEVANTNLEAVFDMILDTAVKNKVSQEELPAKLVIISDMEFDECVENAGLSNFENAKKKYETYGYTLPEIVFWNVESRNRQQPVTMNEQGVALVSGVTPRLFAMVAGGTLSPYAFMTDTLYNERYACITA